MISARAAEFMHAMLRPKNLVPDRPTPRASEDFAHGDKSVLPSVPLPIDYPTIGFFMSSGSF
jgi:hypothetical protein